jgi:RNA polymerase sigma factor (sigma-70 family)
VKQLIRAAQCGDPVARQQLATALGPRLASMARHYARCCQEDFDDLLGEAWFAVFDALDVTDVSIGEPEQYLLKRARWRILDYIKWARRRRCDDSAEDEPEQQSDDMAPDVVTDALIWQVSQGLSQTQQIVFGRLMRGETWREVASHLGCSSANVAYHVKQIRLKCQDVVGLEGIAA